MMKGFIVFLSTALLMMMDAQPIRSQETEHQRVVVLAQVVAYNLSLNLVKLTSTPNYESVLVKVNRSLTGDVKAQYMIVRYEYWTDEPSLPAEFRDHKLQWRLELTRDSKCDQTMADALSQEKAPGLVLVPGHPLNEEKRRSREMVPCYTLRPNGLTQFKEPR